MRSKKNKVEKELRTPVDKRMGAEICAAHDLSPFFPRSVEISRLPLDSPVSRGEG